MKEGLFFSILAFLAVAHSTFYMKDSSGQGEQISEIKKNFAVIWEWDTTDGGLIEAHTPQIALEMDELWKEGNISDVYQNDQNTISDAIYSPGISFVLRSSSLNTAKQVLEDLILFKEGIAKPIIQPIGVKWLGRNADVTLEKGRVTTFVVVWNVLRKVDPKKDQEAIKSDFDRILKYHEKGVIENAYWDLQDEKKRENKPVEDLIFFVQAKNEQEVKKICDNFSFAKKKIASYKMHAVGSFWLGAYKE